MSSKSGEPYDQLVEDALTELKLMRLEALLSARKKELQMLERQAIAASEAKG